jgi:hypothetical protein
VRVLVGCEFSGVVRRAFRQRGHDAWSCDLLDAEDGSPFHIKGDVLDVLEDGWELGVFHPPCTYLSRAGARWRTPERLRMAGEAAGFVKALWDAPIAHVAIENPIGMLNQLWRYPDQTIEPFHFGERYRKRTCLWLRGLPPLMATLVAGDGEPYLSYSPLTRVCRRWRKTGNARTAKDRSRSFQGIADAMADQWGSIRVEAVA